MWKRRHLIDALFESLIKFRIEIEMISRQDFPAVNKGKISIDFCSKDSRVNKGLSFHVPSKRQLDKGPFTDFISLDTWIVFSVAFRNFKS